MESAADHNIGLCGNLLFSLKSHEALMMDIGEEEMKTSLMESATENLLLIEGETDARSEGLPGENLLTYLATK